MPLGASYHTLMCWCLYLKSHFENSLPHISHCNDRPVVQFRTLKHLRAHSINTYTQLCNAQCDFILLALCLSLFTRIALNIKARWSKRGCVCVCSSVFYAHKSNYKWQLSTHRHSHRHSPIGIYNGISAHRSPLPSTWWLASYQCLCIKNTVICVI